MKLDTNLMTDITDASVKAQLLADLGVDGVFSFEGVHDPFDPLLLAAASTDLDIYTNVALAFPRSPMTTAYQAWDLQKLSRGGFMLGLGTQIKPNIEKRYSAHWGKPVAQMREFVEALRAIFACWQHGERLDYRGEYYTHTLMQPTFNPGPLEFDPPPILLGALGPKMTRMTGEIADGILVHPFNTSTFIHDHMVPELEAGLDSSARTWEDLTVICDAIVCTGRTDEEMETAIAGTKGMLAFYGSTPSYRPPMNAHGWGELQPELNAMSKRGEWAEMSALIDDDMLHTLAVVGTADEIGGRLRERFAGVADRVGFYLPYAIEPSIIAEIVEGFRSSSPPERRTTDVA